MEKRNEHNRTYVRWIAMTRAARLTDEQLSYWEHLHSEGRLRLQEKIQAPGRGYLDFTPGTIGSLLAAAREAARIRSRSQE
jgi:hypothetical protein